MNTPDPVKDLIGAFQTANLVALGERHWAREDSEFRLRLIRDPAFARTVTDIVVEFANALHQDLLDGFVNGEAVPPAELPRIWRDTTQPGAWDSPVYEDFLRAVREVNMVLPSGRQLRVLAGDPLVDWRLSSPPPRRQDLEDRDNFARSVIEREVLNKGRKALVLFGSAHLYRSHSGTLVDLLRGNPRAQWFVILPVDGAGVSRVFAAELASPIDPVFVRLAGSPVGDLEANGLFEKGTKRVKVVDGKPVLVPAQVFEPGVRVREVADACLYFGGALPEFVPLPPGLYAGTEYGREVLRRRAIIWRTIGPQRPE
ncbi:MAG: hypothetical protein ACLQU1_29285 [Bryobacteraceae bacterium]